MPRTITFKKVFDFKVLPADWQVVQLCLGWQGEPLLLLQEGKPPQPPRDHSPPGTDALLAWMNTPPKAHHLLAFTAAGRHATTFEASTGLTTLTVQQFGDGWLLTDSGGEAVVYTANGKRNKSLDLGDAIEDVQTSPDGHIWVSYFDEGVFGSGIGTAGLVCFDNSGQPVFKYAELAEKQGLPFIHDCYALNVVDDQEVWLSYYSDFPLVKLKDFQLDSIWKEFESIDHSFAVFSNTVVFKRSYNRVRGLPDKLFSRELRNEAEAELLLAVDQSGMPLPDSFDVIARGKHLCLKTANALYEMTEQ